VQDSVTAAGEQRVNRYDMLNESLSARGEAVVSAENARRCLDESLTCHRPSRLHLSVYRPPSRLRSKRLFASTQSGRLSASKPSLCFPAPPRLRASPPGAQPQIEAPSIL
jgi:hypothetical protein